MSEVLSQERLSKRGGFLFYARLITFTVPLVLWLVHIFVIVPILNTQSGDAQFIFGMDFFVISALIMIGCFFLSVFVSFKRHTIGAGSWTDIVPLLLNLSWLYYVKVLFYGPTFGNF